MVSKALCLLLAKIKYLLTVIDEYSRFSFAFPCGNMEPKTVISCLMRIFNLFRACGYIHSDSGKSFLSREFVPFMHKLRILTSNTSVYHPASNGQCEKYNDVIWSGVKLALKKQNLPITKWVCVTASPSLCALTALHDDKHHTA